MWYSERQIGRIGQNLAKRLEKVELRNKLDPDAKMQSAEYRFTAFGEPFVLEEDTFNPWRYASKRFDPDLGLVNFGKRDYDASLGRWLSPDPAGFVDSLNLYQYAFNNPFQYYDPNGEFLFALAIPFALLFTPAVVTACAEALVVGVVTAGVCYAAKTKHQIVEKSSLTSSDNAEPKGGHKKNARKSTQGKHQRGDARRQREQKKANEKKQKNKKKR